MEEVKEDMEELAEDIEEMEEEEEEEMEELAEEINTIISATDIVLLDYKPVPAAEVEDEVEDEGGGGGEGEEEEEEEEEEEQEQSKVEEEEEKEKFEGEGGGVKDIPEALEAFEELPEVNESVVQNKQILRNERSSDVLSGQWLLDEQRYISELHDLSEPLRDSLTFPSYGPLACAVNGSTGLDWKVVSLDGSSDPSSSKVPVQCIFEFSILRGCSSTRWLRSSASPEKLTVQIVRPPKTLGSDQLPTTVRYKGSYDGDEIVGKVFARVHHQNQRKAAAEANERALSFLPTTKETRDLIDRRKKEAVESGTGTDGTSGFESMGTAESTSMDTSMERDEGSEREVEVGMFRMRKV